MAKIQIVKTLAFSRIGFDINDLDALEELALHSEYWAQANKFVLELTEKDMAELSPRQVGWANKILSDLEDKRRKGKI